MNVHPIDPAASARIKAGFELASRGRRYLRLLLFAIAAPAIAIFGVAFSVWWWSP